MHPEDLLDKEELTEAEQARLDAHLERCATCRYERRLRADFFEEMEGEDQHFDSQEIIALVEGAPLEEEKPAAKNEPVEEAPEEVRVAGLPSRRRRSRARVWMFAAAALLLVGGAAAGPAKGRQLIREIVLGDAPVSEAPPRAAPPATIKIVHTAAPIAPPPEPVVVDRAPEVEPVVFVSTKTIVPSVTAPAAPIETARTVFDDANDARRQGDYGHAIELYRQLQSKFPASREAHVSMGSMGRLQLDRGDTGSALASFDAYQARGHGDLDESVMVGRATALDRLGRTAEAKRAWQALLDTYPSTPYAEHAKVRTSEGR